MRRQALLYESDDETWSFGGELTLVGRGSQRTADVLESCEGRSARDSFDGLVDLRVLM